MAMIAGAAAPDTSALDAMGGGGSGAPGGATPDQVRARIEQAVSQIRTLSAQVEDIGKAIPGSEKLVTQIKMQLRQVAQLAATAGAQQNGSANALPS